VGLQRTVRLLKKLGSFTLFFSLWLVLSAFITPEPPTPFPGQSVIYVATNNYNRRWEKLADSIWRIEDSASPELVYRLPYTPDSLVIDRFSEYEFQLFEQQVTNIAIGGAEFARGNSGTQGIANLWQLDSKNLLVLMYDTFCGQWVFECYGYYELFKLNVENPDVPLRTSLFHIDMHDPAAVDTHCTNDIMRPAITLSPLNNQAVISVALDEQHCGFKSYLLVVDFEQTPTLIAKIPNGILPAWSPDGQQIVYYEYSRCESGDCPANIHRFDLIENTSTLVRTDKSLTELLNLSYGVRYGLGLSITWLDNITLLIKSSRFAMPDGNEDFFIWHNLMTGQEMEVAVDIGNSLRRDKVYFPSVPENLQLPENETLIAITSLPASR
jgi:hypothetical protein